MGEDKDFVKYAHDSQYHFYGQSAGTVRNGVLFYPAIILYGWDAPEKPVGQEGVKDYLCDGISEKAIDLIHKGIAGHRLPDVKNVSVIKREGERGNHQAVVLLLSDGQKVVVDWHATLNVWDPVVTTPEAFRKADP